MPRYSHFSKGVKRRYCFTLNNPVADDRLKLISYAEGAALRKKLHIRYIVFQLEEGAEGTTHFQGYIELMKPKSIQNLRKNIIKAWFTAAAGSAKQNRDYCQKDASRKEGPWEGGTPARFGGKHKFKDAVAMLTDGADMKELRQECPVEECRNYTKLSALHHRLQRPRKVAPIIKILVGETGTGKSAIAAAKFPKAYYIPQPTGGRWWWYDYKHQDVVIWDEFRMQIKLNVVLRLFDRHPYVIEAKGLNMQFTSKTIVITTNIDPKDWYPKAPEHGRKPLERRIREYAQIYDFKKGRKYNAADKRRLGFKWSKRNMKNFRMSKKREEYDFSR